MPVATPPCLWVWRLVPCALTSLVTVNGPISDAAVPPVPDPWLIGPFLDAYLKVNHRSAYSVGQARRWLQPLVDSLEDGCIGSISEIYEAQTPHRTVGCFAQAWSVAEVLRLAIELEM